MLRTFSIAILCGIMLLPSPARTEEAAAPDLQDWKYYSCGTAEDCAVAHTPCGGFAAVRAEHLEELQNWFDLQARMVKCRQPPPDRPQVKSLLCMKSRCELEMTAPAE